MIRISREVFAGISGLMSVGKLVQGLIHNLNGPLQNLGMDMDMIRYSLDREEIPSPDLIEEIGTRLRRMEEEFEQINRLIRAAAARAAMDEDDGYLSLAEFLDREMTFLNTNLYFKHNVESEVVLDEGLPQLRTLAESLPSGLRSLLDAVTEDMERRKMDVFSLKARKLGPVIEVQVTAGRGPLSDAFMEAARKSSPEDETLRIESEQIAATRAFIGLDEAGVRYEVTEDAGGTRITLSLESQA